MKIDRKYVYILVSGVASLVVFVLAILIAHIVYTYGLMDMIVLAFVLSVLAWVIYPAIVKFVDWSYSKIK